MGLHPIDFGTFLGIKLNSYILISFQAKYNCISISDS